MRLRTYVLVIDQGHMDCLNSTDDYMCSFFVQACSKKRHTSFPANTPILQGSSEFNIRQCVIYTQHLHIYLNMRNMPKYFPRPVFQVQCRLFAAARPPTQPPHPGSTQTPDQKSTTITKRIRLQTFIDRMCRWVYRKIKKVGFSQKAQNFFISRTDLHSSSLSSID